MGHEIACEITTAARNDGAPGTCVLLEGVPLKGINYITNLNRDGHGDSSFMSLFMSA